MKKLNLLLLFCLFNLKLFGQEINISTKLSNTVSSIYGYTTAYNGIDLGVGVQGNTPKGNFGVMLLYQFGGSLIAGNWCPYVIQNHFLGGEIFYRVLNTSKRVSPIIGASALTEVASNYRGKYLQDGHRPVDEYQYTNYYGNESSYYVSTPFIASLYIGCDIRVSKNFYFYVAFGYGNRVMKTRHKSWGEIEPDLSNRYSIKDGKTFHMYEIKLGLTYAFSVKKKL